RLNGPRVGRGAFICPRTCADQRRGEAGIDCARCLRRVRTRCVGVNGNRSLRVAVGKNWVTVACGVILENIEIHEHIEAQGPLRTNVMKADGAYSNVSYSRSSLWCGVHTCLRALFPGAVPMSTAPFVSPGAGAAGLGPLEMKMRFEL